MQLNPKLKQTLVEKFPALRALARQDLARHLESTQNEVGLDIKDIHNRLVTLGLAAPADSDEKILVPSGEPESGPENGVVELPALQNLTKPELHLVAGLVDELDMAYHYILTLGKLAYLDPLTELYNRRGLIDSFDRLQKRRERAEYSQENPYPPASLAFFDLSMLKLINTEFSQTGGDKALQQVAQVLRNKTPKGSVVCRLGGDEFAVILYNTTQEQADVYISRIAEEVSKQKLVATSVKENRPKQVPLRVQGACHQIEKGDTLDQIIRDLSTQVGGRKVDILQETAFGIMMEHAQENEAAEKLAAAREKWASKIKPEDPPASPQRG